jgi:hypothetical protein
LDKAKEISCIVLIAIGYMSKAIKPSEKTLHLPSSLITSQRASILPVAFNAIISVWGNHLYPLLLKLLIQTVAIVSPVTNQSYRLISSKSRSNRLSNQGNFMWRSAFFVDGDRKTSAVCNCHEFRTLSPLCFTNAESPFFAGIKVPSMKHSSRSSLPLCFRSSARALRILSNAPFLAHSWNRLWQVWNEGYFSGKSGQGAPVRRIQRMPLSTSLGSFLGLPLPSFLAGGLGIRGSKTSHCLSVKSTLPPPHPSYLCIV